MKVVQLIEKRQAAWSELASLCDQMQKARSRRDMKMVSRFSSLYRDACADLALANAYQLPPRTVEYLHALVARAHNQLYRSRVFRWREWFDIVFFKTPQMVFREPCVHLCALLFWGLFGIAAFLAWDQTFWPTFANDVVGEATLEEVRRSHGEMNLNSAQSDRSLIENSFMASFYVYHNAGIGLSCFVMMLLILPGIVTLSYNAVFLGAIFGYMLRPDAGAAGESFQNFVTAHGPFELTAIILCAGAGLKIGNSWLWTNGLTRSDSLARTARETLPIALCAVGCFCLAAMIEGFISPMNSDVLPWWIKGVVSILSSTVLMTYFVVQGMNWSD